MFARLAEDQRSGWNPLARAAARQFAGSGRRDRTRRTVGRQDWDPHEEKRRRGDDRGRLAERLRPVQGPPQDPVVGERTSVLTAKSTSPSTRPRPPPPLAAQPTTNADWPQPGGTPDKAVGHVALPTNLALAWSATVGGGDRPSERLAAAPVVEGGKVFTIDTTLTVRAFDAASGRQLWATQFGTSKRNNASLFGGGVAVPAAAPSRPTAWAMSPRSIRATAASRGPCVWAVRCAAPRRSTAAPSTS